MSEIERDEVTGRSTTGHEWDGIKELNTPLPRWWLNVLYVTIIWALIYTIFYPAWPWLSGYTAGVLGWSSRGDVATEIAAAGDQQKQWLDRISAASTDQIAADPELLQFSIAGGRTIFNENCAPCHATGGAGRPGYPVLADDSWIWGGTVSQIEQTIRHGVRSQIDAETRVSDMPKFGHDQLLPTEDIALIADYVLSLSGTSADSATIEKGTALFTENCAACHGDAGIGNPEVGGPALNDQIWQYGGDRIAVINQISNPRQGVMPAWQGRLNDKLIKMVSVYVHSLGGGQ